MFITTFVLFTALQKITAVEGRTIQAVIAEVGVDMSRFPTDQYVAFWAGVCPGNNEGAGKRKSGSITNGSPWLKEALVEAARAASRADGTHLYALFNRAAARRGRKRALLAVADAILIIIGHLLKETPTTADSARTASIGSTAMLYPGGAPGASNRWATRSS